MHAAISDARYNTARIVELSQSEPNWLSLQYMSPLLAPLSAPIKMGGHGHMFCPALQLKTWYELVMGQLGEELKNE